MKLPDPRFCVPNWQMTRREINENPEFMSECLRLWDRRLDTKEISLRLFQPEHIVETTVRLGRERRRSD